MKTKFLRIEISLFLVLIALAMLTFSSSCQSDQATRVLVVTGGHEYDTTNFIRMWDRMDGIQYDTLVQPSANKLYGQKAMDQYDVIVYYDMFQDITAEQKTAFIRMLEEGKGIFFLHHSIASYQTWEEYLHILGAHYSQDTSGYQEKLEIPVRIVDSEHPVTHGLPDFTLFDETYFNVRVLPGLKPLLETNHPQSMPLC